MIIRFFAAIFIFLAVPVQGMDLESISLNEIEKTPSDLYRKRLEERDQKLKKLRKDIQEAFEAREDKFALANKQIDEKLLQFKGRLPEKFSEGLQEIRKLLCQPEELFACTIPEELFANKTPLEIKDILGQKALESATRIIEKIQTFIRSWKDLGAYADPKDIDLPNHVKSILKSLEDLVQDYKKFKEMYLMNLHLSEDILNPWGYVVNLAGHHLRVRQSILRDVCCLDSNGPLSFGVKQDRYLHKRDMLTMYEKDRGEISLTQRWRHSTRIGEATAQCILATLFGLLSDPIDFNIFGSIGIYETSQEDFEALSNRMRNLRKDPRLVWANGYFNPSFVWSQKEKIYFSISQRRVTGNNLEDLIEKIFYDEGSIYQLNKDSLGMEILFGILTQSSATSRSYETVENNGTLNLNRITHNSFLHPSFDKQEEKKHNLIEKNILYLFPQARKPIPEEVQRNFASHNVFLLLSYWLKKIQENQDNFDNIIKEYKGLREIDPLLDEEVNLKKQDDEEIKKITEGHAWGLRILFYPETIRNLTHNFSQIVSLFKRPNITYGKILKKLRPEVFHCYECLLNKAKKRMTPKEKKEIFLNKVISYFMPNLRKRCSEMEQYGDKPTYKDEDIKLLSQAAEQYLTEINEENNSSIEEWIGNIRHTLVKKFFLKTYNCPKMQEIFESRIMLTALRSLNSNDNPVIYENLINKVQQPDWSRIPILDGAYHPEISQMISPTHDVKSMAQDLANAVNIITDMPHHDAIEIIGCLLTANPDLSCPPRWGNFFRRAADTFLAFPPLVENLFYNWIAAQQTGHGNGESLNDFMDPQQALLKNAQMQMFGSYGKSIEFVKEKYRQSDSTEKTAGYLLRRLWQGGKQLSPEGQLFFEAILDLLLSPKYSSSKVSHNISDDPGSSGFAAHSISQTEPIKLKLASGEHRVLPKNEKEISVLQPSAILSLEMRETLLSHNLTLLYLQWLASLNEMDRSIRFHPWFMKALIEKSTKIQKMLPKGLYFTFSDFRELFSEIDSQYQQKFNVHAAPPLSL